MWLFVAFLAVPLIEIALFIQVGGLIGLWPTLAIVILTAIGGTALMKAQGRLAINNLRQSFSELNDPSEPLAHGAMILIAGALLLTPGFFTDAVGFALLMPPVRVAVFKWASARIQVSRFEMGAGPSRDPFQEPPRRPSNPADDVIEGDFQEISENKKPNHPGSGWTRH